MGFERNSRGGGFGGRDRGSRFGGSRSFGGRDRDGGSRERRPMVDAVCDKCGKDCQLPFKPTGDKPVFCSDCFRKEGGSNNGAPRSSFSDRNSGSSSEGISKEQFNQINAKLDKILKLLEMIEFEPLDSDDEEEDSDDDDEEIEVA